MSTVQKETVIGTEPTPQAPEFSLSDHPHFLSLSSSIGLSAGAGGSVPALLLLSLSPAPFPCPPLLPSPPLLNLLSHSICKLLPFLYPSPLLRPLPSNSLSSTPSQNPLPTRTIVRPTAPLQPAPAGVPRRNGFSAHITEPFPPPSCAPAMASLSPLSAGPSASTPFAARETTCCLRHARAYASTTRMK